MSRRSYFIMAADADVARACNIGLRESTPSEVAEVATLRRIGEPVLLRTGAKAYHVRGGLWRVRGYAASDYDARIGQLDIREARALRWIERGRIARGIA